MGKSKFLSFVFCVMLIGLSSPGFATDMESQVSNSQVFEKADLFEFVELVKLTGAEEWDGRDRLIRAKGTFSSPDEEKIINLLHAKAFEDSDDITFISGDEDRWWELEERTLATRNFVKSIPGQDTFVKLITTSSGVKRFLLEQTDF